LAIISIIVAFSFLAIFIKNDHKEFPAFSARLWLPLIWMLLTSTRLLGIIFPTTSADNAFGAIEVYLKGNATEEEFLLYLFVWV